MLVNIKSTQSRLLQNTSYAFHVVFVNFRSMHLPHVLVAEGLGVAIMLQSGIVAVGRTSFCVC